MSFKIAIIGSGYMAEQHIIAFQSNTQCEVVGITSRNEATALDLAQRYGIDRVEKNIPDLFKNSQANGVLVAVNEPSAIGVVTQCMAYSWKILTEKPLGLFVQDTKLLAADAKKKDIDVFVAMNRRHYASTRKAIEFLDNDQGERFVSVIDQENITGALKSGQPREVVERWMVANSIHLIDYFSIFCRGRIINITRPVQWDNRDPFVIQAVLSFDSGDKGAYTAVWDAPGPWSVSITTRKQMLEMRPLEELNYQKFPEKFKKPVDLGTIDRDYKAGLAQQTAEFIASMSAKKHNLPSLSEYIITHELVEQIYPTGLDLSYRLDCNA